MNSIATKLGGSPIDEDFAVRVPVVLSLSDFRPKYAIHYYNEVYDFIAWAESEIAKEIYGHWVINCVDGVYYSDVYNKSVKINEYDETDMEQAAHEKLRALVKVVNEYLKSGLAVR